MQPGKWVIKFNSFLFFIGDLKRWKMHSTKLKILPDNKKQKKKWKVLKVFIFSGFDDRKRNTLIIWAYKMNRCVEGNVIFWHFANGYYLRQKIDGFLLTLKISIFTSFLLLSSSTLIVWLYYTFSNWNIFLIARKTIVKFFLKKSFL